MAPDIDDGLTPSQKSWLPEFAESRIRMFRPLPSWAVAVIPSMQQAYNAHLNATVDSIRLRPAKESEACKAYLCQEQRECVCE